MPKKLAGCAGVDGAAAGADWQYSEGAAYGHHCDDADCRLVLFLPLLLLLLLLLLLFLLLLLLLPGLPQLVFEAGAKSSYFRMLALLNMASPPRSDDMRSKNRKKKLDVSARPMFLVLTGKRSGRTGWRLKARFCAKGAFTLALNIVGQAWHGRYFRMLALFNMALPL